MPLRLEQLAESIGHWTLRRRLRELVLDPVTPSVMDVDVLTSQALVGARASTLVSFNIEELSALPFQAFAGGKRGVLRTFRERKDVGFTPEVAGGPVGRPIYFPHGTLTMGNLVMTQSEYDKFHASAAMETAVHLCMGGDLVILGMSLSDEYLRKALLRHRRWIRDIYWFDEHCRYREWAHVADVTLVTVPHSIIWNGLGAKITEFDKSGFFEQAIADAKRDMLGEVAKAVATFETFKASLDRYADRLVAVAEYTADQLDEFARACLESGLDVPSALKADSRYIDRRA